MKVIHDAKLISYGMGIIGKKRNFPFSMQVNIINNKHG